jgi:hypothetical protein
MMKPEGLSRRGFMALAGGSAAGAALLSACGEESSSASDETSEFGKGDVGVLNFLLTVEHVMSALYEELAGSDLFDGAQQSALSELGEEEEEHIAALVKEVEKLGGDPVAEVGTKFSLSSDTAALELASEIENAAAAAYLGQLPNIENAAALKKAVEIHTVEGRHAAAIDYLLETSFTPDGAFAEPSSAEDVLAVIQPYMVE